MSLLSDSDTNAFSVVPRREPAHSLPSPIPPTEQVVAFSHYIWLVRHNWWKIAIAVTACTLVGAILSVTLTPAYESVARLAVDLNMPTAIVGQGAESSGIANQTDQYFNTELQLIQSDIVLRPVAEQFNLLNKPQTRAVPAGFKPADAPVVLKNLKVNHPANSLIIEIGYRSTNPLEAAQIANAVARSYIVQGREMRAHASGDQSAFMEKQIGELKKRMDESAEALAVYQKELGLINPEEKTSLLSSRLSQLNTELTEAQSDRVRKEVDYKAFKSHSLAAIQVSPQAVSLSKLDEAVRAAQAKMALVKSVYGSKNMEYKKAANELAEANRQDTAMRSEIGRRIKMEFVEASSRERLLRDSLAQTKAESDALNARAIEYEELKRTAESDKNLYTELFRKVEEAGINGAFQGSAVRLADPARPSLLPIFPNKAVFLGVGFLFSLLASMMAILVADLSDRSLRDPEQARQSVGVDVLGILPNVSNFNGLFPISTLVVTPSAQALKASRRWFETPTFYRESIRSLLSSILLGRYGHPIRSVVVTSAEEGEGKSSCVAHLAAFHAMQGNRVLLIDADLRRPAQHRIFGLDQREGLTDAILFGKTLSEIKHQVSGFADLDIIPAGSGGPNACNHVARIVGEIVKAAGDEYDAIFIDAPPILCFAEPLQLSSIADGVLVLCRAGNTSQQAVASVRNTLNRLGALTLGLVLNQVKPEMSSSYGPYHSYYRRQGAAAA